MNPVYSCVGGATVEEACVLSRLWPRTGAKMRLSRSEERVGARGIEPLTPTMSRRRSDCLQRFELSQEIRPPVTYCRLSHVSASETDRTSSTQPTGPSARRRSPRCGTSISAMRPRRQCLRWRIGASTSRGNGAACLLKIVEADDGHVPSRDHSLLVKGAHRPYRKQVAEADDRRQFRRDLQELAHAGITLVTAWWTRVLPKVGWSKAVLQQDFAIGPYSPASRRRVRATSHPADRSVSERNEMRNRRGQTLLVFNADPIESAASYFPPRDNNGQPLAEGLQVPGCRADCRADDEARDIALD